MIDRQHGGLLSPINDLCETIRTPQSAELPGLLDKLEEYTRIHFATEERLLRACGYDGYERHKEYHDWMVQKTIGLQLSYRLGEGDLSSEMFSFLKNWWIGHIQKIDKQYASAFLACRDSNSA
jgi:hemerythrin